MPRKKQVPIRNPEGRMNQIGNMALDEVERRLENGTITSQLLAVLLKCVTAKYQLELEKMRVDIDLQKAKTQEIEDKASNSDLYSEALKAFKEYSGGMGVEDDYEDYYEE